MSNVKKFVRKDRLSYKSGYLVTKKGKIRQPEGHVVFKLNQIDRAYQIAQVIIQRKAEATDDVVNLEDTVKLVSEYDNPIKAKAETPVLDQKIADAKEIMKELDRKSKAETSNKLLDYYKDVFQFVNEDCFICENSIAFNLPVIGNPLELETEELVGIIDTIAQASEYVGSYHRLLELGE